MIRSYTRVEQDSFTPHTPFNEVWARKLLNGQCPMLILWRSGKQFGFSTLDTKIFCFETILGVTGQISKLINYHTI